MSIKTAGIPPSVYTREYYLRASGGYEHYAESRGACLGTRQQCALTLAALTPTDRVLDLGCGRGELTYQAAVLGCHVVAADYSAAAVALTRETVAQLPATQRTNVTVVQGDICSIPLTGAYDVIFLMDVIEHLTQDQIQEFLTHLRAHVHPGSRLILHTDNAYAERWLAPVKNVLSMPFTILNQVGRLLRGHRRERSWAAWWSKTFQVRPPAGPWDGLHVSVLTPDGLRQCLASAFPRVGVHVTITDERDNPIVQLLKRWWGRDLWAVVRW